MVRCHVADEKIGVHARLRHICKLTYIRARLQTDLLQSTYPHTSAVRLAISTDWFLRILQSGVNMNPKSYPLRTALIGLSSSAATSWAASAHLPSLLSDAGRTRYAIKGLLNSSIDASKLAIETYRLPSDIKTYGSPEELAADPDIDIVICNTRVDRHYDTILPSVRAGKDVFVEWPIAAKTNHIEELVGTAKQSGSRIAVGLQRRWNPIVVRLRELVGGGRGAGLGKLLNVEARMFGASNDREVLPTGLKYFTQKEVGGNAISIGVGHGKSVSS